MRTRRQKTGTSKKVNVFAETSERKGLAGLAESFLRRFKVFVHILLVLPLYFIAAALAGLAMTPGIYLYHEIQSLVSTWDALPHAFATGASLVMGYFLYGFSMIVILPVFNTVFRLRLKEFRGPYYSLPAVPWYIHNGVVYFLRYTFLEMITPTPFNLLFYKGMGMKIGRGTVINTTAISDPSLISMGKKVTIGGSVTIVGHYGQAGYLVLAPVKIEDGVTVGLRATVMGGVHIGADAKILPHSVVMPKTVIPAGETWGGVPAVKIEERDLKKLRKPA